MIELVIFSITDLNGPIDMTHGRIQFNGWRTFPKPEYCLFEINGLLL
jgi:hypothetical protein